jgi:hypothetical protein
MELESSLQCSQESSTGPYPDPDRCSPYCPLLSKINFNIPSGLFRSGFPTNIYIPLLSRSYNMPFPSHSPLLDHSNYIWRRIQVMNSQKIKGIYQMQSVYKKSSNVEIMNYQFVPRGKGIVVYFKI